MYGKSESFDSDSDEETHSRPNDSSDEDSDSADELFRVRKPRAEDKHINDFDSSRIVYEDFGLSEAELALRPNRRKSHAAQKASSSSLFGSSSSSDFGSFGSSSTDMDDQSSSSSSSRNRNGVDDLPSLSSLRTENDWSSSSVMDALRYRFVTAQWIAEHPEEQRGGGGSADDDEDKALGYDKLDKVDVLSSSFNPFESMGADDDDDGGNLGGSTMDDGACASNCGRLSFVSCSVLRASMAAIQSGKSTGP